VPAHHGPLMAAFAQCHTGVLPMLFDVVGIAWACCITHAAGQFLDLLQVLSFSLGWVIVHPSLSMLRLEASSDLHTSTRACAATNPQRKPSAFSTAAASPLISSMYSMSA